jgi:hypothetical protein
MVNEQTDEEIRNSVRNAVKFLPAPLLFSLVANNLAERNEISKHKAYVICDEVDKIRGKK